MTPRTILLTLATLGALACGEEHPCKEGTTREGCTCGDEFFYGEATCRAGGTWGPCACETCEDACPDGAQECLDRDQERYCADLDGDGCAEWSQPTNCWSSKTCREGRCQNKRRGDWCSRHEDCPDKELVCASLICAPMYGRDYLFSVTRLQLREKTADLIFPAPEPYVITYIDGSPDGEGVFVGMTAEGVDTYEMTWSEQQWRIRIDGFISVRLQVLDADGLRNEPLDSVVIEAPFPAGWIKAGGWSVTIANPDRWVASIEGTVRLE